MEECLHNVYLTVSEILQSEGGSVQQRCMIAHNMIDRSCWRWQRVWTPLLVVECGVASGVWCLIPVERGVASGVWCLIPVDNNNNSGIARTEVVVIWTVLYLLKAFRCAWHLRQE